MRFTLVSIDGATGSDTTQELVVGALIGPTAEGRLSGYTPVTLSFASGRTTAVSTIPIFGAMFANPLMNVGVVGLQEPRISVTLYTSKTYLLSATQTPT